MLLQLRPAEALAEVDGKPIRRLSSGAVLDGADPAFVASFDAQVSTLAQGIVGDQTRPGEPVNYPLEWLRDGTFIVTALAHAGQVDLAVDLAREMAPKDFFGGFGAEGDAPGLSLWMLAEVSAAAGREEFDRKIWPQVKRKAQIIIDLLNARGPTEHEFSGPIVPMYANLPDLKTVAFGLRAGLIDGRMDLHRPLFYVSAASYGGLRAAAEIADRLGESEMAADWRKKAQGLKDAWRRAFVAPEMAPTSRTSELRSAGSGLSSSLRQMLTGGS